MAVKEYNKESPNQPDDVSGGMVVIDSDHHMIHRYAMFTTNYYNLTIADNGVLALGLEVPTNYEIHLKALNVVGYEFPWILDASPHITYTESGTYKVPFNHHMSTSPPASKVIVNVNPTGLPATGEYSFVFGGGSGVGGTGSSGAYSPSAEFIMHSGKHFIRITNKTGSINTGGVVLVWYEIDIT